MMETRHVAISTKLCGGYVAWDTRAKDAAGFPIRRQKEVYVRIPMGVDVSDCGEGTAALIAALKAKVGPKPNIAVRECWEA